ncbi:MAG: PAS domain-containing protein [Chlamydiales bacterium]|nr:PAS domain-containing protein [Chlamydiales bacterium]
MIDFAKKQLAKDIKARFIWLMIIIGVATAILSWEISFQDYKKNIKALITEQGKTINQDVRFIYAVNGQKEGQKLIDYLMETIPSLNTIILYDVRVDQLVLSSEKAWIGKSLQELPREFVGEDIEEAIKSKSLHTGVRQHKGEFDVTIYTDGKVFMAHISNVKYFKAYFQSAFFNEFLSIIFLISLVLFPLFFFVRHFLVPYREQLSEIVADSPFHLGRFSGNEETKKGTKLGVFSFLKQLEEDIEATTIHQLWLSSVLQQQPVGLLFSNQSGEVVTANQKMLEILGVLPELAYGDRWLEVLHPEDRERVIEEWRRVVGEQVVIEIQFRFRTPDGLINWVNGTLQPIRNLSNDVIGILGTFVVANKQKRLEKTMEKGENLLSKVLSAASMGYWDWKIKEDRMIFSEGWCTMLGYTVDEVEQTFAGKERLVHPDDIGPLKETIQFRLMEGKHYRAKFRMKNKEGDWIWILSYGSLVERDEEGKPKRAIGIHLNINDQMEQVRESVNEIEFITDDQGKILGWSDRASQVFSFSEEEAKGKSVIDLFSEEKKAAIFAAISLASQGDKVASFITDFHCQGVTLHLSFKLTLKDKSFAWVGSDVTERAKMSERVAALEQEKSNLVTIISHQLRTPLSVVQNSIEILRELSEKGTEKKEEFQEYLDVCKNNVNRVTEMIHDTLDYEELEFHLKQWNFQITNPGEMVQETAEPLKKKFEEKGLVLTVETSPNLPTLMLDRESMIKSLSNLMRNALQFTEKGGVTVRLYQKEEELIFEVQDTGVGIRKEDFPTLFTMFAQIHSSNLRFGSGLGLVIAKKIVEEHGGGVSFESEFGKGSTFRLHIPIKENS